MQQISQDQIQQILTQNQRVTGSKGPVALRLNLDFTAPNEPEQELDLQHIQSLGYFDLCQTIFVDNYQGGAALEIFIPASGQRLVTKAGNQGYMNAICPNPINGLRFTSAGGARVTVFLINSAIPGSVWEAV